MNILFLYIFIHTLLGVFTAILIGVNEYVYIDENSTKYVDGNFIIFMVPIILLFSPLVFTIYFIEMTIIKFGKKIQVDYSTEDDK